MAVGLPQCNGNYRGCIAELAVDEDYGHHRGDTQALVEQLEFVAKACANLGIAGESCLLMPVAARVGLAAMSSQTGRSIYDRQIADAMDSGYPEQLDAYYVIEHARQPKSFRSDVSNMPVPASTILPTETAPWVRNSIIISAYGEPLSLSPSHMGTDGMDRLSTTMRTMLNLNQLVCSSLIKDQHYDHPRWRPAPARVRTESTEAGLNIIESVDGLILSRRSSYRAQHADPQAPPEGSITLEWPRDRVVHIASNESA